MIVQRIRAEGPLPFASYVEIALYHPKLGYYASKNQRSGRTGDFFTSIDLGTLFGELLASQFSEMWELLTTDVGSFAPFDLIEVGAGNGRLTRDILNAIATTHPEFYKAVRATLIERSPVARAQQSKVLSSHANKIVSTSEALSDNVRGVIFANELLDAFPPHVIFMTNEGLREIYVDFDEKRNHLVERIGPLSSAAIQEHVNRHKIKLEPGWRAEINLEMVQWIRTTARKLTNGFLLLIDYGHEAKELYSETHSAGTLTTYCQQRVFNETLNNTPAWLVEPGNRDITTHVDLTAVREAAEREGLLTLGVLDQTYFLLGLGAVNYVSSGSHISQLKQRLSLKSLLIPGGIGSTHKVLIFSAGISPVKLAGCSYNLRAT